MDAVVETSQVEQFIERWQGADGTERSNCQTFMIELCDLLELPKPAPGRKDSRENAYVFERHVTLHNPDGSTNNRFIDLYRRGSFVLEAKQTGKSLDTQGWDKAMLSAQNQADEYVRALPPEEGRPPFIVVTDVGRTLELYAEFSRSGGAATSRIPTLATTASISKTCATRPFSNACACCGWTPTSSIRPSMRPALPAG